MPLRTIAHERSPVAGERHQAAVRDPPADPSDMQMSVGPRTKAWPSDARPRSPPSKATRTALAAGALARGQGWFGLQVPSISRAAMPASRTRGPSAHQIGPSPSQTLIGVQVKLVPFETVDGPAALAGEAAQSPAHAKAVSAAACEYRPSLDAIALIASTRDAVAAAAGPDANFGTRAGAAFVKVIARVPALIGPLGVGPRLGPADGAGW